MDDGGGVYVMSYGAFVFCTTANSQSVSHSLSVANARTSPRSASPRWNGASASVASASPRPSVKPAFGNSLMMNSTLSRSDIGTIVRTWTTLPLLKSFFWIVRPGGRGITLGTCFGQSGVVDGGAGQCGPPSVARGAAAVVGVAPGSADSPVHAVSASASTAVAAARAGAGRTRPGYGPRMRRAWPAPVASAPIDAVVRLPGSKSVTNRALVVASLAAGTSRLRGPLRSRDTDLMRAAMRALGAAVADDGDDVVVTGAPAGAFVTVPAIDLGNAGTVARFVPAVAALRIGDVVLDGDPRMRERPITPLLVALRALGADVTGDSFPVTVRGRGALRGGAVTVDASGSSQLVSGLLLAGPLMDGGLDVRVTGGAVPSRPHLAMTVAMMRASGAEVAEKRDRWVVSRGTYAARDVDVEPDLSGAAPFLAAAVAVGGVVRVPGWPATTTQPGAALPGLLEQMGAAWSLDAASGLVLRGSGTIGAIDADLRDVPEAAPVLAALACLADGPSRLRGIAHLRLQETDRLRALATELSALGAVVTETDDGLTIEPKPLRGKAFATYDDHRLAMAAAVVGLAVPGIVVEDVDTVAKTMPDFTDRWQAMLG